MSCPFNWAGSWLILALILLLGYHCINYAGVFLRNSLS